MKQCHECKVSVHKDLTNCPLCGSYLDEADNDKNIDYKNNLEDIVSYPKLTAKTDRSGMFLRKYFFQIVLIPMAVSIALNILLTPTILWSAYVILGLLAVYVCIITPIFSKRKLSVQINVNLIVSTILFIALDFLIFKVFSGISISYAIPSIIVMAIITSDIFIVFVKTNSKDYYLSLFLATIWGIIPMVLFWIFKWNYSTNFLFILFFFAIANFLLIFIFYGKKIIYEFRKKFHL